MYKFFQEKGTEEIKTFYPENLEEISGIIDYMKTAAAIISLNVLPPKSKQRALDIITGATVALGNKICPLSADNYLAFKE